MFYHVMNQIRTAQQIRVIANTGYDDVFRIFFSNFVISEFRLLRIRPVQTKYIFRSLSTSTLFYRGCTVLTVYIT